MRVGYCSCLVCVYPSVPALAPSASVETSKQRYSRVSVRLFLDLGGFSKNLPFQSYGMQIVRAHRQPLSRVFFIRNAMLKPAYEFRRGFCTLVLFAFVVF